jgi:hypothetical protein
MKPRRLISVLSVSAMAAAAAVVSGCGASSVTGGDEVANAAAATIHTHGSKVSMSITMSSDALSQPVHITAGGVLDQVNRRGEINVDMSDLASATGQSGVKPSDLRATEILSGTVFYIRFPLFDGKLPHGKKWIKLDLQKAGKALGINFAQLMQPGQDPSQQVAYLRTMSDAKKVGTDTIRGVSTTHYHGIARLDRYPQIVPPAQRAAARAAIQRVIKLTGVNSMPMDAWVDHAGKVRRVAFTEHLKLGDTGQSADLSLTEDLYDFGTKVDVAPPPDDQVLDVTKETSKALRSGGLGG